MDMPMDYHVRGTMLKRYQRYTPKLTKRWPTQRSWKAVLLTVQHALPHKFIHKTIILFCNGLDRVLLQLVNILNILFKDGWAADIHHQKSLFELPMKRCAKFDLLFVNIQCTTAFTQKVNFRVQTAVSIEPKSYVNKFAGHLMWVLMVPLVK